jgi:predicted Zn finger-like uncharacterized protein
MKIECTTCSTAYNIDDSKIPSGGATSSCKKCQSKIRIEPPNTNSGVEEAVPAEIKKQPDILEKTKQKAVQISGMAKEKAKEYTEIAKDQAGELRDRAELSKRLNETTSVIKDDFERGGIKGLIRNKYFITASAVLFTFTLLAVILFSGGNKYSFLLDDTGVKKIVSLYKKEIKTNQRIMDYLNLIVSNPQDLYEILQESECDPEILEFAKSNKELTLVMLHHLIIMGLYEAKVTDQELFFVTNYVKSPTAMAATNQIEMGMETEYMRAFTSYQIYEQMTAPGGIKDNIEDLFHRLEDNA